MRWYPTTIGKGFVAMELSELVLISAYISPNSGWERFKAFLADLEEHIKGTRKPIVLTGDFNAECLELGEHRSTGMRYELSTMLSSVGMTVVNITEELPM